MECVFGEDPDALEVRERMPEPSRVKDAFMQMPLRRRITMKRFFELGEFPKAEPCPKIEFQRVRVQSEGGAIFFVWTHKGQAYL